MKRVLERHFVSLWGVVLARSVRGNRAEYKTTIFARAFYGVVARYFSEFRRLFIIPPPALAPAPHSSSIAAL